jgi:2'-5' RNA ligase
VSDERARLFVALELPDDVREELIGWRSGVLPERPRLRLIAHEHLHVTLCFLGWQEVTEIGRIGDVLSVAAEAGAARLALGDGIWLPSRRPRVLAATLADRSGAFRRCFPTRSRQAAGTRPRSARFCRM